MLPCSADLFLPAYLPTCHACLPTQSPSYDTPSHLERRSCNPLLTPDRTSHPHTFILPRICDLGGCDSIPIANRVHRTRVPEPSLDYSAHPTSYAPRPTLVPQVQTPKPKAQSSDFLSSTNPPPSFNLCLSSNLAGSKRRSLSAQGGLLFNKMFGGSSSNAHKAESNSPTDSASKTNNKSNSPSPDAASHSPSRSGSSSSPTPIKTTNQVASGEKRSGNGSPPSNSAVATKRRSSGVSGKASSLIASAKNSLNLGQVGSRTTNDSTGNPQQTPIQKLGKQDPSLVVPQGQHNNAAGESLPGPKSTFRVGVWEDRNKKCRRTMEDTHAFLYNFLHTPAPALASSEAGSTKSSKLSDDTTGTPGQDMLETDNGYFAIFDGHAGTFAADWCGKKLHIILEDVIKKNPNAPIPELLDQTFTTVDTQLEKLPLKNSGCTAAIAVLRWEERVPSNASQTGSQSIAPALAKATGKTEKIAEDAETKPEGKQNSEAERAKLKDAASRQRVLYTANVGDARIILCRSGKALRLSYDHKGSDENEGKRITNAGGLILNNRVNGVLAVTRALGDSYMKDLVTGHPYTTETVIQPDMDEFIIIACDGVSTAPFPPLSLSLISWIALGCLCRSRGCRFDPQRPGSHLLCQATG